MKRVLAAAATAALLVAAVWFSRGEVREPSPLAETPQACIRAMFAAARDGDVQAYRAYFTGAQLDEIDRQLAGERTGASAQALREAIGPLKGLAMTEVDGEPATTDRAALSVERVYEQHSQRQVYRLQRGADGGWRIVSLQQPGNFHPPIAYGTPVWEGKQ